MKNKFLPNVKIMAALVAGLILNVSITPNVDAQGGGLVPDRVPQPNITDAEPNLDTNTIRITGVHFTETETFAGSVELYLSETGITNLVLDSFAQGQDSAGNAFQQLVVSGLPANVGDFAGTHLLVLRKEGKNPSNVATFPVTLGAVGPVGPEGPAGADGAQGPQGIQGPIGPQGPAGADGADGADGTDGADGADGAPGPEGPRGPAGEGGVPASAILFSSSPNDPNLTSQGYVVQDEILRTEGLGDPNAPSGRNRHTAVWTGSKMIIWGGDSPSLNTGAVYDPATETWTPTSLTGAPSPRGYHTAVWTGSKMIIWGGIGGNYLNTGGVYDPLTDTWTPTSLTGAPSKRYSHTAVWTGSKMIIFGGKNNSYNYSSSYSKTGGVYDPATDTWTPTSLTGAPATAGHTAVWTGSKMIIWGGQNHSGALNTGAVYDPVTDTWTPTSLTGAPSPRSGHTAVWTGSKMIIWDNSGNTGGVYDPVTDAWTSTSMTGAPSGTQFGHTAVWTGSKMIIFGGGVAVYGGHRPTKKGGIYDPATDTWTPISGESFYAGLYMSHTAVWTGSKMIIFKYGGAIYDPSVQELFAWQPLVSSDSHVKPKYIYVRP